MKNKKLLKNLKEFRNFYEQSLLQAKKDKKDKYLPKIREKITELEELINKYG